MRLRLNRYLLLALFAGVIGCASSLPSVTPTDAERVGVAFESLQAGRTLYVSKCSGCHALILPNAHTDEEWAHEVDEMAERARLTEDEKAEITLYLTAMND